MVTIREKTRGYITSLEAMPSEIELKEYLLNSHGVGDYRVYQGRNGKGKGVKPVRVVVDPRTAQKRAGSGGTLPAVRSNDDSAAIDLLRDLIRETKEQMGHLFDRVADLHALVEEIKEELEAESETIDSAEEKQGVNVSDIMAGLEAFKSGDHAKIAELVSRIQK